MDLIKLNKSVAQPFVQPKPINITTSSSKSLYGEDYFNGHANPLSFDQIFDKFKIVTGIKSEENQRQTGLDELVYLRLCQMHGTGRTFISIPVCVNNKQQTLLLSEANGLVSILIEEDKGNGKKQQEFLRALNISFAELKEKLAAQIALSLINSEKELPGLSQSLDWLKIAIGDSQDPRHPTKDTAPMIVRNGRLSTVVVDGSVDKLTDQSKQLPVFGQAIAIAALHTVECGILTLGIEGEELQTFFEETVKLLLQFQQIETTGWPKLNGIVFYQEAGMFGVHKIFEYGTNVPGKNFVNVNVTDTVPDEGFTSENKYVQLSAARDVEGDDALYLAIDAYKLIAGSKDDFIVFSLSPQSSRYKYVEPSYPLATTAKLDLDSVETKEEEKLWVFLDFGETKEEKQRVLIEQQREQQREKQIQLNEKRRIRTNHTADIFVGKLTEFAEEYDGPDFGEKLSQDLQAIENLKEQKIRVLKKQNELIQLEKTQSTESGLAQVEREVQLLNKKVFVSQKKVLYIFEQQDRVQKKLEKNLVQLRNKLEQKQKEPVIPEESEKRQLEALQFQNEVLAQQKKLAAILEKKEALDQTLAKQKKMDEILGQRHAEQIKSQLAKKIDEARSEEKKEKLQNSGSSDKTVDEI